MSSFRDLLNSIASGMQMMSANSLKKCRCQVICLDLGLLAFSIQFLVLCQQLMSLRGNLDSSKILSNLSVVNTLQKNSFSESAFSFGVVAFDPSDPYSPLCISESFQFKFNEFNWYRETTS